MEDKCCCQTFHTIDFLVNDKQKPRQVLIEKSPDVRSREHLVSVLKDQRVSNSLAYSYMVCASKEVLGLTAVYVVNKI